VKVEVCLKEEREIWTEILLINQKESDRSRSAETVPSKAAWQVTVGQIDKKEGAHSMKKL
jgi:hypothetical protein